MFERFLKIVFEIGFFGHALVSEWRRNLALRKIFEMTAVDIARLGDDNLLFEVARRHHKDVRMQRLAAKRIKHARHLYELAKDDELILDVRLAAVEAQTEERFLLAQILTGRDGLLAQTAVERLTRHSSFEAIADPANVPAVTVRRLAALHCNSFAALNIFAQDPDGEVRANARSRLRTLNLSRRELD